MKKAITLIVICLVMTTTSHAESSNVLRRVDSFITGNTWQRMDDSDKACYMTAFLGGYSYMVGKMYDSSYDFAISRAFHSDIIGFFDSYVDAFNDSDDIEKWIATVDGLYRRDERYIEIPVAQMFKVAGAIIENSISDAAVTDRLESLLGGLTQRNDTLPTVSEIEIVDVKKLEVENVYKRDSFLGVGYIWAKITPEIERIYIIGHLNGFNDIALRVQAGLGSHVINIDQKFADEIERYINACAQQPDVEWWQETVETLYEMDESYVQVPVDFMIEMATKICIDNLPFEAEDAHRKPNYIERSDADHN